MEKIKLFIQKSKKAIVVISVVLFSVTLVAFTDNYFEVSKNLDVFATLFRELNTYYVDNIEPNKMMKKGIDAMLDSLDPYTSFYDESETEDLRFQTTGKYGGIGALISKKGEYVVVSEPYFNFPAYKAGIIAGDAIIEVDGQSVKNKPSDDVRKMLIGQPGTELKILVRRPGEKKDILKTLTREEIKINSVPYYGMVEDGIGYIKLGNGQTGFPEKCGKEVRTALEELKKDGNLKGIILDLRDNPGGLLNEAVNVANVFIDKGQDIVSTKGKIKDWDKNYKTLNPAVDATTPLVVLTNRGSASASEIVAGAIQDFDRGVIVGQRTYGKGLVQTTRPLSYNTQLKVTTAKYYIPSGRCIQAIDYAHRNEDGSVAKIPDSLKVAFKTKSGRTVYDGGGVETDIAVEPQKANNITISLANKDLIFDFATQYRQQHETIISAKDFHLNDKDFDDFINFLSDKEYDYKTKSEDALDDLQKKASDEKYLDAIKDDLETMKTKISHDKKKDLYKFKDEIVELLEWEIASRYYYQKGRIEASFNDNPEIKKAMEILKNINEYNKALNPTASR